MKALHSIYPVAICCMLALASCSTSDLTPEEKLAGKEEKTWKARGGTSVAGNADRLSGKKEKQSITFWRNGNVTMTDGDNVLSGQWTLDGMNLSLQFTGSDVSENFTIVQLKTKQLKLKAGDGSEVRLKPD